MLSRELRVAVRDWMETRNTGALFAAVAERNRAAANAAAKNALEEAATDWQIKSNKLGQWCEHPVSEWLLARAASIPTIAEGAEREAR